MISTTPNRKTRPTAGSCWLTGCCLMLAAVSLPRLTSVSGSGMLTQQQAADMRNQYKLLDSTEEAADTMQQQGEQGYYAFEKAPNMEPPLAPRPPFEQATSACPGSDPFASFSPKHTLCGDLYRGKVPLNPMGQLINDQAYPFELIKNKTLQFLAKSLPILKTEYNSIPKVFKYMPSQQLLNPTHLESPLSHEHFHALNQRHQLELNLFPGELLGPAAPAFIRRKRSAAAARSSQQRAAEVAAELSSNASLVVSSAHSSSGRILGGHHQLGARSAADPSPMSMITKDGLRPISSSGGGGGGGVRSRHETTRPGSSSSHSVVQQPQAMKSHAANQNGPAHSVEGTTILGGHEHATQLPVSPQLSSESETTNTNSKQQQQQREHHQQPQSQPSARLADHVQAQSQVQNDHQQRSGIDPLAEPSARAASQLQVASPLARSSAAATLLQRAINGGGGKPASVQAPLRCNANSPLLQVVCQTANALIEPEAAPSWMQTVKQIGTIYSAIASADGSGLASGNAAAPSPLLTLWNGLASGLAGGVAPSTTTSALEPNADQEISSKSAGSLQSDQKATTTATSGNQPLSAFTSIFNMLSPLVSLFGPVLQRADSSLGLFSAGKQHTGNGSHLSRTGSNSSLAAGTLTNGLKTAANLLVTSFSTAYLLDWITGSQLMAPLLSSTTTSFARRKKPFEPGETFAPASLAALESAKQLTPAALISSGNAPATPLTAPPTPCPSNERYISPTFARNYQGVWKYVVQIPHEGYFTQTIQQSSCTRQKCQFTEGLCHESPRWVSLLVAEIFYPYATLRPQTAATVASATTPMAEGNLNERYDQAAVLNQLMATAPSTSQLQQAALAGQHQTRSLNGHHQDPLQMIDSLNTYNHNQHNNQLNNLLINSALELGIEPASLAQMQQLAGAQNYQFLQRYGLIPITANEYSNGVQQFHHYKPQSHQFQQQQHQQQQQQHQQRIQAAESRSSPQTNSLDHADNLAMGQKQITTSMKNNWQQFGSAANQPILSQDEIKALAMQLIREHPGASPEELIRKLVPHMRKRRDLTESEPSRSSHMGSYQTTSRVMQQAYTGQKLAHISQANANANANANPNPNNNLAADYQTNRQQLQQSASALNAENLASINELNSAAQLPQHQSQQHQSAPLSSSHHQYQQRSQTSASPSTRTNQPDQPQTQQQQTSQLMASQPVLVYNVANSATTATSSSTTGQQQQQQQQADQQVSDATNGHVNPAVTANPNDSQIECDGHDKHGCYVVRVYYDWFLVNGSCKCWKPGASAGQQQSGQSQGGGSSTSSSFIKRIFSAG